MVEVGRKQHKKTQLRVNGGIAGLIALSGAIAAAALVSVFRNRSKRRPNNDLVSNPSIPPLEEVNNSKKKEEDSEGLRSLLPNTPLCEETLEREEDGLRICLTPFGSRGQENETDLGLKSDEKAEGYDDCGPVVDNLKESLPQADDHDVGGAGICVLLQELGELENGSSNVIDNKEDPSSLQPAQTTAVTEDSFQNSEEAMIPHMEEPEDEVDGDEKLEEGEEEEEEEDDDDDDDDNDDDDDDDDEEEEEEEEEEEDEDEDEEEEDEEEEEEKEIDEFSDEKDGVSSDETGDSSIESSAAAVWPTESFEVQGMKICGDLSTETVKEDAEMGLEGEFAAQTKKKYEENGSFRRTTETECNMEKEKGVCALIILMEKAVSKSSISRLLLLFLMVGLALYLLRSTSSYNPQDSSPNVV
ncbi:hypothetical protein ACLOJK_026289 [Asimina triloba]